MAHIQRRCPTCSITVPARRQSCEQCGQKNFRYRVRYTDPEGREKSRTFRRRADAETFLTATSHTLLAGSYVDPAAGRQTVRAYLEAWRQQQAHHRPKTVASTATRFRTMVYALPLGNTALAQVKPSTIRTWQKDLLERGYAPATIKGVRGVVAGAFRDAILDRILAISPFDGVKTPEVLRERVVPRTPAQVRAGQAAMPERYRAVIPVAAGTGLRWGELFGLTVDRVDFLRKTVTVDRQLVGRVGPDPVFGPPKTPASYRTIPIAQTTVSALAAHLAKYPAEPGQLVFRTSRGTPLTRTVFGRAWRPAAAAMGLEPGQGLHQLRHFYASLLIAARRSVTEVQERLGHASAQETLDTYSHLWEGNEDGTRAAIEQVLGNDEGDATQQGDAASSDE